MRDGLGYGRYDTKIRRPERWILELNVERRVSVLLETESRGKNRLELANQKTPALAFANRQIPSITSLLDAGRHDASKTRLGLGSDQVARIPVIVGATMSTIVY